MTWKELHVIDQKERFIEAVLSGTETFSLLCDRFNISRTTGYKVLAQFKSHGLEGLQAKSRAPHHHPNQIPKEVVQCVLQIKVRWDKWGPKKIKGHLEDHYPNIQVPSHGSIGNILKNHGLTAKRRLSRKVSATAPLGYCTECHDVWMYDFKGWFLTQNGSKCEPLTVTDGHSRYLLACVNSPRKTTQAVWEVMQRLFLEHGLPSRIRSDNGPPFASLAPGRLSSLAILLIKAGVTPEWIEPGKPEQNGRHERFHRTLKLETATPPAYSLREQEVIFDQFRTYYNTIKPPVTLYKPSVRVWDGTLRSPEYSDDFQKRKVCSGGNVCFLGRTYFLSETLKGEYVGILEKGNGYYTVSYGPIALGEINLRSNAKRI
jgi:putative transposase